MTTDAAELAKAFAYFNESVDLNKIKADQQAATKRNREGAHPIAQQAFTKVGSYMAAKLAEKHGAAKLDSYAALSGLVFVDDYLALTKSDTSIPKDFQLTDELKTIVAQLAGDWRKTNTAYVRNLYSQPTLISKSPERPCARRSMAQASIRTWSMASTR